MPVSSTHVLYDRHLPLWQKQRTTIDGEEAVKSAGEKYLPSLTGMSASEYTAYLMRAMFYAAAGRTVQGLLGAILRKDPIVTFSAPERLATIGINAESFNDVIRATVREVISVGRVGLLVDAAASPGSQPYIVTYTAESITNWLEAVVNGRREPVLVVLREEVPIADPDDIFNPVVREQYRVLKLTMLEAGEDLTSDDVASPTYVQEIWVKKERDKAQTLTLNPTVEPDEFIKTSTIVPRRVGGGVFHQIPFVCINTSTTELTPEKGPLLDLTNVNLSHYRTSADLEHGRHYTALPTAWVSGAGNVKTELRVGGNAVWILEDPQARAGYLEFTGAGLRSLSEGLAEKEKLMAVLGARMLEERPNDPEAAEAVKLRQAGEYSALATLSQTCSAGLTYALQFYTEWIGRSDSKSVAVALNQDFNVAGLLPATLQALMAAVQSGLMSYSTWFHNLKRAEFIPDGRTLEEETALVEDGLPLGDAVDLGLLGVPPRLPRVHADAEKPQE